MTKVPFSEAGNQDTNEPQKWPKKGLFLNYWLSVFYGFVSCYRSPWQIWQPSESMGWSKNFRYYSGNDHFHVSHWMCNAAQYEFHTEQSQTKEQSSPSSSNQHSFWNLRTTFIQCQQKERQLQHSEVGGPISPEDMLQLRFCGIHHLLAVSLLWLGSFQIFPWIAAVWWLQVLVWLGIPWLFSVTNNAAKMKMLWANPPSHTLIAGHPYL